MVLYRYKFEVLLKVKVEVELSKQRYLKGQFACIVHVSEAI